MSEMYYGASVCTHLDVTHDPADRPAHGLKHYDSDLQHAFDAKWRTRREVKQVDRRMLEALAVLHAEGYVHTGTVDWMSLTSILIPQLPAVVSFFSLNILAMNCTNQPLTWMSRRKTEQHPCQLRRRRRRQSLFRRRAGRLRQHCTRRFALRARGSNHMNRNLPQSQSVPAATMAYINEHMIIRRHGKLRFFFSRAVSSTARFYQRRFACLILTAIY
jgi:hypothetical protein